jgi:2-dehydro-3-deoxyphosphogalactonate aldolase
MTTWSEVSARLPLIAILRGVTPQEAVDVARALADAGLLCVEVTLNSPEPLRSIAAIRARFDGCLLVGAGTVLRPDEVAAVADAGAQLVISPNCDDKVIAATKVAGLVSLPGVFTPTEAFAALAAGADALKLFPAEASSPAVLKAMAAALPAGKPIFPVGGIEPKAMVPWRAAGAAGFGIGGALYRPGRSLADIQARAEAFVAAWRAG